MSRDLLNYGAYVDFVQSFLVQAQYWHDPLHFDTYVEKSQFIAEVNNEKAVKNETYAVNLASLENFVMVKHNQDSMVEPRESSHFEFYTPGQSDVILPLKDSGLQFGHDVVDLDTTIWRSANETGGIQRCKLNFGTSPNTKYTYSSICCTVGTFSVYCKYLSTSYKFQSPNWRTPPQESPIYTEDRIGLKTLDESGRLHLMAVEGNHLEFSRQWFIDEIINVYLKN